MRCYLKFISKRVLVCFKPRSLVQNMKIVHVFLLKKVATYGILNLGPVSFGREI